MTCVRNPKSSENSWPRREKRRTVLGEAVCQMDVDFGGCVVRHPIRQEDRYNGANYPSQSCVKVGILVAAV